MKHFNEDSANWFQYQNVENKSFICGFCGDRVASDRGYRIGHNRNGAGKQIGGVYICPNCNGPNFHSPLGTWYPGSTFGRDVQNVPEGLSALYEESRRCFKEKCNTGAVLISRKMLMNIAVEQGAKEGLKFIEYVNYLAEKGFIPPNGKKWVDHIRKKGNEATHEIQLMNESDAKDLITFVEMMLIFLYEFPSMIDEE